MSAVESLTKRATRVQVLPIVDSDLPEVGEFLGRHYPPDTPADQWADAWRTTVNLPGSGAPNHGFLLRADGRVVGAYPTIYSTRMIAGRVERFCNLAVWCTAPEYRLHSARLVRAVLGQDGFHFTDLTPIEVVQRLNERMGFRYLDTTAAVMPNLPWPSWPGRTRVSSDPAVIERSLTGAAAKHFADHRGCRWARHLVVVRGDASCYVQWRMERHKRLPVFASIRYASDPALLRTSFPAVARHLLLRHGALATIAELRVTGGRVRPSRVLEQKKVRMYRSDTLDDADVDYLYSEISSAP